MLDLESLGDRASRILIIKRGASHGLSKSVAQIKVVGTKPKRSFSRRTLKRIRGCGRSFQVPRGAIVGPQPPGPPGPKRDGWSVVGSAVCRLQGDSVRNDMPDST